MFTHAMLNDKQVVRDNEGHMFDIVTSETYAQHICEIMDDAMRKIEFVRTCDRERFN